MKKLVFTILFYIGIAKGKLITELVDMNDITGIQPGQFSGSRQYSTQLSNLPSYSGYSNNFNSGQLSDLSNYPGYSNNFNSGQLSNLPSYPGYSNNFNSGQLSNLPSYPGYSNNFNSAQLSDLSSYYSNQFISRFSGSQCYSTWSDYSRINPSLSNLWSWSLSEYTWSGNYETHKPTQHPSASPPPLPSSLAPSPLPSSLSPVPIQTTQPSARPSAIPTHIPQFFNPTSCPSIRPSSSPTLKPSELPTYTPNPTVKPSVKPSIEPSPSPTSRSNQLEIPILNFDAGLILSGLDKPEVNRSVINLIIESIGYTMGISTDHISWIKTEILARRLLTGTQGNYNAQVLNLISIPLTGSFGQYSTNTTQLYTGLTNSYISAVNSGAFYTHMITRAIMLNITGLVNLTVGNPIVSTPNITYLKVSTGPTGAPTIASKNSPYDSLWLLAIPIIVCLGIFEVIVYRIKIYKMVHALNSNNLTNSNNPNNFNPNSIVPDDTTETARLIDTRV